MKKVKWTAIMAIIIWFAGFQANAQRGQRPGHGMRYDNQPAHRMGEHADPANRMQALLDLSEEQLEEIETLYQELEKESLPTVNKIGEKRAQLRTRVSENADLSGIDQLIEEIADLQVELDKLGIRNHFNVRELLTDEQKIKFDNHFSYRIERGMHHFGPYGMRGRGWN